MFHKRAAIRSGWETRSPALFKKVRTVEKVNLNLNLKKVNLSLILKKVDIFAQGLAGVQTPPPALLGPCHLGHTRIFAIEHQTLPLSFTDTHKLFGRKIRESESVYCLLFIIFFVRSFVRSAIARQPGRPAYASKRKI